MLTLQKADNPLGDALRQTWSLFRNKPQNGSPAAVSISTANQPIDNLLTREWLLTNERGSYASSTIAGCNTRGYHGLLIGSLNPPVNRIMALANCLEMVIVKGHPFNLSTFEFNDKFAPAGFPLIKQFRRDTGAHFDYKLPALPASTNRGEQRGRYSLELTKSVYLLRDTDTVALLYDFTCVQEPAEFIMRPFVGLRDFHTLQQSHARLYSRWLGDGVFIRHDIANSSELFLSAVRHPAVRRSLADSQDKADCPPANFENDRQWWFNFVYRSNRERGQDFTEDLWTPGFFKCTIDSPTKIILWANLSLPWTRCKPEQITNLDIETVRQDLHKRAEEIKSKARNAVQNAKSSPASQSASRQAESKRDGLLSRRNPRRFASQKRSSGGSNGNLFRNQKVKNGYREYFEALCLTSNEFIAKRQTNNHHRTTIVAGYPWFADWGRDAFIALPGLLLSTGRFDEAKSVLTTFAAAADEGMIPNRFDDRNGTAHFNSVDASLWFINAAFQYLQASDDSKTFTQELLPTIQWIIDSYNKGTRFDIHADADGLITAGDSRTQLTWMDAKYEGVAFTPRCGKAVEVNALWYNSLCLLAQFYADLPRSKAGKAGQDIEQANHYKQMAQNVQSSFCELFFNESKGYLNDCILPDGSVDDSLRPNQIFAVSLGFSALSAKQQKSVVNTVQDHLLTPYGLRTLNVQDSRYKGVYTGPQHLRDEAYHQGTVWAFLLGPFVESYLKVNGFSRKSKRQAAKFIQPLLKHLTEDGCLGSVSEIFDGDAPHKPKGCIAQAWSVAELIRAYQLINS